MAVMAPRAYEVFEAFNIYRSVISIYITHLHQKQEAKLNQRLVNEAAIENVTTFHHLEMTHLVLCTVFPQKLHTLFYFLVVIA